VSEGESECGVTCLVTFPTFFCK